MEGYTIFMDQRTQYSEGINLSKMIYRFDSNKNFIEIDLNDSKINMDPQKSFKNHEYNLEEDQS